ncbi:DNA helicase UvrD [Candidatus Woesearchaeota archaeon]|nr:DNA helicase UvrD [Candidatus Woesearchaeota archaeon]
MEIIADLHMHSRNSRGCSKDLDLEHTEKYAKLKGIHLLGTGDFTHPAWNAELKKKLTETSAGSGIFQTATKQQYLLQTEISLVYTQDGRGRRVHQIVLAPSFEVVDQIVEYLKRHGRVDYDGRPIFKIPSDNFVYELHKISHDIEVIPAHIWTPWFALFGSKSGFNSIKDCFGDQVKHVHALETGMSSDPAMNWRLSQLDQFNIVSFSDAHSYWPWRIGREATIFEVKQVTYKNIVAALRTAQGLKGTIEVDPEYGKYHEDGHRACGVCMTPQESLANKNLCPKCKRPLTIGVHHRVEELADRPVGFKPKNRPPFTTVLPLAEIIAHVENKGVGTKSVSAQYYRLLQLGSEFDVLLRVTPQDIARIGGDRIAAAILKSREGAIKMSPGYDGEYGHPVFDV